MKNTITRREWMLRLAAATTLATIPAAVRGAMGPNDKFDLVIKGGEVLDPSQKLRAVQYEDSWSHPGMPLPLSSPGYLHCLVSALLGC